MRPDPLPLPRPPEPPRAARALLRWFCAPAWIEEIEGDLAEQFAHHVAAHGRMAARLLYWAELLQFARPHFARRSAPEYPQAPVAAMLKNYVVISLRHLRRHAGYAALNVAGLAFGLGCCILILLYVRDELGFDRMHARADRIHRIVEARPSPDQGDQHQSYTYGPLGPALVAEQPEVTASTRLLGSWMTGRRTLQYGEKRFYEGQYFFAEPGFFDVFDFALVRGDRATALAEPLSVVLSEAGAQKYFGAEDPIGKTMQMEPYGDVTVTGVVRVPHNSHLGFDMLFSFSTLEQNDGFRAYLSSWDSEGVLTYVVLADPGAAGRVQAGMQALLERNVDPEALAERRAYLQPLVDVHFRSGHIAFDENVRKGDVSYLYIFSAIGLFILFIACVNYMNLATARSMQRAREVGMRKVVGARRSQLIFQFLGESTLMALSALVLALGLVWLALPSFNALADKAVSFEQLARGPALAGVTALVMLVGLLAGSYPAFYLSRFRPATVLKGSLRAGLAAARLRRGLVVTQFALSILLIVATLVISAQLRYVQQKRLGFDATQLVVVDINDGAVRRDFETVKREFARHPAVERVSVSSNVPGDWKEIPQIEVQPEGAGEDALVTTYFLGVDEDFVETFAMRLVEGRAFMPGFGADSASVLLNETAAQVLGAKVGSRIRVPSEQFEAEVVGVVADFHFRSLHEPIAPMVMAFRQNPIDVIDYFTIRADAGDLEALLAHLRQVGERFDPRHPFEYNFLDARMAEFYAAEQRVGRLFGIAAGLAVVIACLGLFGLAAFSAEQRTKEIGIRKALGASPGSIVVLLSKDFVRLVAVAFVVAAPAGYLLMDRWLADFAYRTQIGAGTFLAAGALALCIAVVTVSYQSIRAALTDPVRSLRYE